MSRRYARFVVVARWWIVAFWAAVVVGSMTVLPSFGDAGGGDGIEGLLDADSPAVRTELRDFQTFGFPLSSRTVVVQRDPDGLSPYVQARTVVRAVGASRGQAKRVPQVRGALPITNTRGLFPGAKERNTTALTYLLFDADASLGTRTRSAERYARTYFDERDSVVGVTGSAPARRTQGIIIRDALPTVELVTLLAIMGIVGLAFRSLVAPVVTVLVAGVAYVATVRMSGAAAAIFDLSAPDELEPVIVALLLGVVTDYVVFFCSSLRDEVVTDPPRDAAHEPEHQRARLRAVTVDAVTRSGPIVAVAGLAVTGGTASLLVAQSPFFRALGPALAFTVTVGLLVAITLVPALLAIVQDRVFFPARPRAVVASRTQSLLRLRTPAWSRRVVTAISGSKRVAAGVLVVAVGGLALGCVPVAHLAIGASFVSSLPEGSSVRLAADSAQDGFAEGILSPTTVLLEGTDLDQRRPALREFGRRLAEQPGVAGVLGPGSQPLPVEVNVLVSRGGNAARYLLILDSEPLGAAAVTAIDAIQDRLPQLLADSGLADTRVGLAGDSLTASFLVAQTEQDLLRIAIAALLVNLLMLLVFLRSLWSSLVLLGASVLSLGATLGITSELFAWAFPGQGLTFYVPFAAAVLLLAFGSDYNIFTVGHVWEAAGGRSLRSAIDHTLPSSVGAVTTAGVALATSFGLLALVPLVPFYQLAFAVGLGLALDVFVLRLLVVPAVLTLLGRQAAWPSRKFRDPGLNRFPEDPRRTRSALPS